MPEPHLGVVVLRTRLPQALHFSKAQNRWNSISSRGSDQSKVIIDADKPVLIPYIFDTYLTRSFFSFITSGRRESMSCSQQILARFGLLS